MADEFQHHRFDAQFELVLGNPPSSQTTWRRRSTSPNHSSALAERLWPAEERPVRPLMPLRRALYAYNHSWAYVDKVLAYAAAYGYVDPSSIPARAVELARSRIGAPYVWGAEGPDAFDCSGLVLWVYSQLGLQVPRTAQQQFEWAVPIDPSQLCRSNNTWRRRSTRTPEATRAVVSAHASRTSSTW